jgi:hypothetical protein
MKKNFSEGILEQFSGNKTNLDLLHSESDNWYPLELDKEKGALNRKFNNSIFLFI